MHELVKKPLHFILSQSSELTSSASSCDCRCNSRYMASLYSKYARLACLKLCTTTPLTTMKTASPHTVQASTVTAGMINAMKPMLRPPFAHPGRSLRYIDVDADICCATARKLTLIVFVQ